MIARLENARVLEAFFGSTITPLVLLDRNFNFIRVNEAYAKACFRPVSEFPGHNHFKFYPSAENEEIFRNVVKSKRAFQARAKPFVFPDHPEWGTTYWDWTLSPVLDDAGEVEFLVFSLNDVTEEARAQEELRRSESLLRKVLDTLPVGVWITDKTGRIIMGNPAGEKIWAGARYVGIDCYGEYKGWWVDSGRRIQPEEWAAARAVTKGETSLNEEIEIESFDGTRKFILHSALPIRDEKNEISGAIIVNQDITLRREGEKERRQQAALLELSRDAIFVRDFDDKITFWNRGAEDTYGWTKEKSLGRATYSHLKTSFPAPLEEVEARLLADGHWEGELVQSRKDGRRIVVESRWALLPGQVGRKPAAIIEINRDITERKAAEEERLRLVTAVEQIAEGIAVMDLEGRILYANPVFYEHHGLERPNTAEDSFPGILQIDANDREIIQKMREALAAGRNWNWHLARRTPDGRVRELELTVFPIRDGEGRLVNSMAVERDVTQEVRLQERIRQWQKMEALGTLAGGIAHDFNNILLPIQINAELMLGEEKGDTPAARHLGQVLEAARRGKEMVNQIIAFSRQTEQDRKPVDLYPVIKESLELLRISMPKNIEISEKIEVGSAPAIADPTQIHQIMMNLGSNAAHAMRERGGVLEVGLSEVAIDADTASRFIDLKPGPHLRLWVKDSGHGMTPEVMRRVFEPFYTTKKQDEGAGMGLAVVHGIVKSHGGAIAVSSEVGKGSEFTIYLPRIVGRPEPARDADEQPFTGSGKVLFVDDEDIQVRAMDRLLDHLGYRAVALSDARKALELFRGRPGDFDLAIMDQTMPRMSGGELARELLKIRPDLPIILCTGYSENLNEEEALAMGIKAFLMKPFSVKEIADTIRRVLPPQS
jgi:PAS domain S-box-containing protein